MLLSLAKKYGLESYEEGTMNVQWQRGWRTGVGGAFVSIYEPPGQLWTPEWLLALPEERRGQGRTFCSSKISPVASTTKKSALSPNDVFRYSEWKASRS
ncbi:hypothetical protein CEXT_637091 [Caerostris extrusa]|uniref:Uncharacterized protein n=1 Tax=Caerostris extrusa TaxID=172846 RepID=A0AAV4TDB1_CAEEX|nr:hypothetical protein CEXT_637091 [Caerostris extrusa]